MKVSIITPCFNSASTLEHTIHSVLSQDYNPVEYIVIDGRSNDETQAILDKYKDSISICLSEKDQGSYDALNKGISLASGDIIGVINADDFYVDEGVVNKVVQAFITSGSESVYGNLQYVSKKDSNIVIRNWISGKYNVDKFKYGWMPPHPSFFVKKQVYTKYGAYSLELSLAADYEFMLRVLYKHRISTVFLNEVLVKMRAGGMGNRSISQRIKANREDRQAWRINGLKPGLITLFAKPLRKLIQFSITRQWLF